VYIIKHMVPWAFASLLPQRHLGWFIHFCTAHGRDQQTGKRTTLCSDVSSSVPHLALLVVLAMRANAGECSERANYCHCARTDWCETVSSAWRPSTLQDSRMMRLIVLMLGTSCSPRNVTSSISLCAATVTTCPRVNCFVFVSIFMRSHLQHATMYRWLGSRVVSVLDSGAEEA